MSTSITTKTTEPILDSTSKLRLAGRRQRARQWMRRLFRSQGLAGYIIATTSLHEVPLQRVVNILEKSLCRNLGDCSRPVPGRFFLAPNHVLHFFRVIVRPTHSRALPRALTLKRNLY